MDFTPHLSQSQKVIQFTKETYSETYQTNMGGGNPS